MVVVALAGLLVLSTPATVLAQSDPASARLAEELFREGHALLEQARYRESCAKFAESHRKDPAVGTLLALAYCEERGGRLASAWRSYQQAAALAAEASDAERQAAAQERAAALQPRLSTLTVKVPVAPPEAAEIRVRRDGSEIDRNLWGTPLPVDGGSYVLEASKAGRKVWSFTVTVQSEADHQTVTISDVRLEHEPPSQAAVEVRSRARPAPASAPPPQHDRTPRTLNHVGWGLAIASAATIGLGTTLALIADLKNDRSNSNGRCDERGCDERGLELRNEALSAARWATASFAVGSVLAVSSVTLFVVADAKANSAGHAGTQRNSVSMPGVTLSGRF